MPTLASQGLASRPFEINVMENSNMLNHANGQKPLQEAANLYGNWKLFQPEGGVAVLDVTVRTHCSTDYSISRRIHCDAEN